MGRKGDCSRGGGGKPAIKKGGGGYAQGLSVIHILLDKTILSFAK